MSSYELRPLARFDMLEIWAYTVGQWGRRKADAYIRELTEMVARIAQEPHLGAAAADIRPGYRKHPFRSHIIFYEIGRSGVVVVRILHQQMDAASKLS